MALLALGLNHKTAPLAIRERVVIDAERLPAALHKLHDVETVSEAAIVSTCNRTELYCDLQDPDPSPVIHWLTRFQDSTELPLEPYLYSHLETAAVRHLLRVVSGLDSMIVGEPQILGQVKTAYRTASEAGTLGIRLNRLFQHSFAVAKRVRTDTRVGVSAVSVAFAAVSLARQIFDRLSTRTALLIGAGETIELAAHHLRQQGIGRMIVANRTLERARHLAGDVGAFAIGLEQVPDQLHEADLVICSTASPTTVLQADQLRNALKLRRHNPMLLIDLAVPRDVDPAVSELADAYLYTVDDLESIIEENRRSRAAAAVQAEEIIDAHVGHFLDWLRSQRVSGEIRALRTEAEQLRERLVSKALRQLGDGRPAAEIIERTTRLLSNKLVHGPSVALRQAAVDQRNDLVELLADIYRLPRGEDK